MIFLDYNVRHLRKELHLPHKPSTPFCLMMLLATRQSFIHYINLLHCSLQKMEIYLDTTDEKVGVLGMRNMLL